MSGRTYSEREVAQIIERAVERQQEAARATPEAGLTMEEIERLGGEVGIDPRHLRAAAAAVDAGTATGATASGGTASQTHTHLIVERWLDGPLAVEGWEDALAMLHERFGVDAGLWTGGSATGTTSQVGNTYEWVHTGAFGIQTRVSASARGDRTRLRLSQYVGFARPEVEGPVWGVLLTLIVGVPVALAVSDGNGALFAAVVAAALVLFSAGMLRFDRRWRAKKLRALGALADELGPRLVAHPALPAPDAPAPAPLPAPDAPRLPLPDDAPEPEPARPRGRTRA